MNKDKVTCQKEIEELLESQSNQNYYFPLPQNVFDEIYKIIETLRLLKSENITDSKTYNNKLRDYKLFKINGLVKYGIEIKEPFPFSNPLTLLQRIDKLLIMNKNTNQQRNEFFKFISSRKRTPKKEDHWLNISKEDFEILISDTKIDDDYIDLGNKIKNELINEERKYQERIQNIKNKFKKLKYLPKI